MARKIFLSFLGTSNYIPCHYEYKESGRRTKAPLRFIQEALLELWEGEANDEIDAYFFLTEKARTNNWETRTNKDGTTTEGLKARLAQMGLSRINDISIEDATSEEKIWSLFTQILEEVQFKQGDTVFLDITHAFRSLPMLGMVLLSYVRNLYGVEVQEIAYGAFEALGNPRSVPEDYPDPNTRIAPIFNLTSFAQLQDWSNAAYEWKEYGYSTRIENLVNLGHLKMLTPKTEGDLSKTLSSFVDTLKEVADSFATVRGATIREGEIFERLKTSVEKLTEYLEKDGQKRFAPLTPILHSIKEKVENFKGNDIENGFRAVQWCINHKLTQQGITLLQEHIVSMIIYDLKDGGRKTFKNHSWKTSNFKHRNEVTNVLYSAAHPQNEPLESAMRYFNQHSGSYSLKPHCREYFHAYAEPYEKLRLLRNDINHAGEGQNAKDAAEFLDVLEEVFNTIYDRFLFQNSSLT